MSPRAVLSLSTLPNVGYVLRIEEEIVPLQPDESAQTICNFDPLDELMKRFGEDRLAPGTVGTVGSALYEALAFHGPTGRQLVAASQPEAALLIDDASPDAQVFPWEALKNDSVFWGLDDASLLGRTVSSRQQPQPMTRVWDQKLRVLAVLAATGSADGAPRTAADELSALVQGLSAQGAPPFELRVLGCDFDLGGPPEADVREAVALLKPKLQAHQRVDFRELQNRDTIKDHLTEMRPHIVHFFCHGLAANDMAPRLELALRSDQLTLRSRGSLLLEAEDLAELLTASPTVWLLVLNCCLGAAATESISLARNLLARAGRTLPAIVAMREAIDRRDAHLFTRAFYREAATLIAKAVQGPSASTDLQWLRTLPSVRRAMCQQRCAVVSKAADCREWTVPVMYIRREPFQICKKAESEPSPSGVAAPAAGNGRSDRLSELQAQLTTLKTLRAELEALPTIPPGKIQRLDDHIAQLQQQLIDLI